MRKFYLYMRVNLVYLLLITIFLSGCSSSSTIIKRNVDEQEYAKEDVVFDTNIKSSEGYYNIATVGDLQLLINGKTTAIQVRNLKTGVSWNSNPQNEEENDFISSQFSVSYIARKNRVYERNNYADSVKSGQYSFYPLKNGIRVNYTVNEKKQEYLVPPIIEAKRFNKFLSKLSEEDKMMLSTFYIIRTLEGMSPEVKAYQKTIFPALRFGDVYVLASGFGEKGVTASDLMLQMIEPYFIKAGYTKEDLKYDAQQNSLEEIKNDTYSIELSIEYTLDENGLTAKIPQKSIIYDEETMKLTKLTFLPFMGAVSEEAEGFLLVPDGSGAIINLNNGKKTVSAYEKRVYSPDNTLQTKIQDKTDGSQIYLPVFGVSSNQNAMLAVIEQGDALATIHADVSGKLNDYNYIYSSYCLIQNSVETNSVLNQSGGELYQKTPLESDIQIKYLFKDNNGGSYVDMAECYRNYLLDNKKISKQESTAESMPFVLNTIGAVSYTTTKFGIPVDTEKALTTFEQAEDILDELGKSGIKNVVYSYSGWMNNGLHGMAPYKINPVKALGGKKAFNDLIAYVNKNNIEFFPEVNFSYVSDTGNGYSKNEDTARDLSGNLAKNHTYNLALQRWNAEDFQFIVSPLALGRISESFLKSYSKYDVSGVSLPLLSKDINGDYNKTTCCDRQNALKKIEETFAKISKAGYKVQVEGANAYSLSKASFVTSVPTDSGNHYLFDENVPFYQSVLHGVVPYSATPLNFSGDFNDATLKCIEYGAVPYFQWIYADNIELKETDYNLYNVNYKLWLDDAVNAYKKIDEALSACQDATIVAHEKVSKDLYKTAYSNGYSVYVNYSDEAVEIADKTIKANDYAVVKGDR